MEKTGLFSAVHPRLAAIHPMRFVGRPSADDARGMKTRLMVPVMLLFVLAFSSCGKKAPATKPLTGPPQAGVLYSLSDNEGGFRAGKVVALEEEVFFVHLYSDRWTKRPSLEEARKARTPVALAFTAVTFTGMQPVALETGQLSAEELEDFDTWQKGKREVF